MDIRQLRYFMAVVEEGTVSAAARKLHISQPPLSRQMHMLEEECGVPLFERGARHIRVTQAGSTLYRYASEIVELEGAAEDELSGLRAGKFGTLRIGTVSSCRSAILRRALIAFRAERPEFRFRVSEGNTYELLEQIRKFEIELAFIRTPFPESGLEQIVMQEDPMMVCGLTEVFEDNHSISVGPANPSGESQTIPSRPVSSLNPIGESQTVPSGSGPSGRPVPPSGQVSPAGQISPSGPIPCARPLPSARQVPSAASVLELSDLEGLPLIIYRRWESILRDRFAAVGITPTVVCICEDARTALQWAAAGIGAAVLPVSVSETGIQASSLDWRMYTLKDAALRTRLTCVRMRDAAHTSQADRFFELVRKQAEQQAERGAAK